MAGEILSAMHDLASEGVAILVASHEMGFAREVADRVCFSARVESSGRVRRSRSFDDPHEERTKAFLSMVLQGRRDTNIALRCANLAA